MINYEKPFMREIIKLPINFRVIDCPKAIYELKNEMDYLNHCNEFLHIQSFVKLF